jgi:hypothetical protein
MIAAVTKQTQAVVTGASVAWLLAARAPNATSSTAA